MDKQTQNQGSSENGNKNPTLNDPGAKVADYGNPTGGSANEDLEGKHGIDSGRQGNSSIATDNEDTIGNP